MLGGFKAGCRLASEKELQGLDISGLDYVWLVPHSADTNLGKLEYTTDVSGCVEPRINGEQRSPLAVIFGAGGDSERWVGV